mmetsp:Transcript_97792/g.279686  ORF Transcript_97792/g.279686 Transcript_97792/m.279686 type:complete len:200 (+) Transcript_97792:2995-3594(+)
MVAFIDSNSEPDPPSPSEVLEMPPSKLFIIVTRFPPIEPIKAARASFPTNSFVGKVSIDRVGLSSRFMAVCARVPIPIAPPPPWPTLPFTDANTGVLASPAPATGLDLTLGADANSEFCCSLLVSKLAEDVAGAVPFSPAFCFARCAAAAASRPPARIPPPPPPPPASGDLMNFFLKLPVPPPSTGAASPGGTGLEGSM